METNRATTMEQKFNNVNGLVFKPISFASIILKGHGQIMLQENTVTGLLFLIGIFYGSFIMGCAVVLATICGTTTAFLLKFNKAEINKGLYGFSAALTGGAVILFFKPVFVSWLLIIFSSVLAAILQHFFIKRSIPVFTLPFVLLTWLMLFLSHNYATGLLLTPTSSISQTSNILTYGFKGYGQVIFQDSLVSGIIFFIAVFISSPISALYGLLSAILASIIALKFAPINDISLGLWGFNAVLCAIAFAGNHIKDIFWVLLSVLLSLTISFLLINRGIPQLTFPFVFATCLTLFIKKITKPYITRQI